MWTYILTALCLAAFLFEIYHFFRGFANKDRKEIVFYVRSFKKIKYLAVYLTAVPLYFTGIFYSGKRFWDSIFIAINKVVNLVVLKYEVDCIDKLMTDNLFYRIVVYFCFAVVGFTAVIFTLSLFVQQLWVARQKRLSLKTTQNKLYIFGYNPQNLAIYNSDGDKRWKAIVDNISEDDAEALYLDRISYISTTSSEDKIKELIHDAIKLDREYVFVINTGDEEKNIRLCTTVIDEIERSTDEIKKKVFLTVKVFVFGDPRYQAIYEDIISSGFGCVHYVNKYQKMAVDFIDSYPLALFMNEHQVDYESSLVRDGVDINVALIGFGQTNQQIFLTSVANNQFLTAGADGEPVLKQVKYFIFDKDPAENNKNLNHSYYRFEHECSNIDNDDYLPLPSKPAEEKYFHLDINSKDFYNEIRNIVSRGAKDANFIIIAFGSDLENLDMAQKLVEKRKEWELENLIIFVKARSWHKEQTLLEDKGCYFIGNENDCVYDIEKIIGDRLYNMAKMRNETYDLENEITHNPDLIITDKYVDALHGISHEKWFKEKSQMDRDSSLFGCLSLRSKLNLMGLDYCLREGNESIPEVGEDEYIEIYAGDDKPVWAQKKLTANGKKILYYDIEFKKSRRRNMAIHEHQRWNSFMISRGIVPSSIDQILYETAVVGGKEKHTNGKNYAVRRHGNLTTFDGLVKFREMVAGRDGCLESEADVIKYDYQILDDAYWLLSKNGYKIIRKRNIVE